MKLPQYLTHYDNPEMGDDSFLFRMRPVKNDDNQLTFVPDDDQTVKFTWRNDTLAFVNTTADSRILGMATTAGEWGGFGDDYSAFFYRREAKVRNGILGVGSSVRPHKRCRI